MIRSLIFIGLFFIFNCFSAVAGEQVKLDVSTKYLNSDILEVLIKFDIADKWHMFAPYKQEFGEPLSITWKPQNNIQILEESYSHPKRFEQDDFSYDGYENVAFYKTTLNIGRKNTNNLSVNIRWQACAEECIPSNKTIKITPFNDDKFDEKLKQAEDYFVPLEYNKKTNFITVILMAFIGGIILNLMPCIFPILSIKIMALLRVEEKTQKKEALLYGAGVIFSMIILAGILFIFRLNNHLIGWGFQLQSLWFVFFLLLLFVIMTLLMLDIISVSSGWLSKLACFRTQNSNLNAFMMGLLAVLIATPCTAPFMGAAIGYALISPIYVYFPIFLFLGLGYALPFVLLVWHPWLIGKILPKPGNWMIVLKKIMSIPLFLTCVWLLWLLMAQLGFITSGKNLQWQSYTPSKVEQAIKNNRPVFIDFTANWCITCLVNKKTALQSDKLAELVKEKNILLLRADATNHSDIIAKGLQQYGRMSVPLYIYYDGKSDDYLLLPQILTPNVLDEYIM